MSKISNLSITDRVKSFEDACEIAGINHKELNQKWLDCYLEECDIAFYKLRIIISVINEGWKPNWNDSSERKWYPYFNMAGSFAFVDACYHYGHTYTSVGSRLCFKTENDAKYAGKQFIDLYRIFYTYQNDITRNTLFEKFKEI